MKYSQLMKQAEYREAREVAREINSSVRKAYKKELLGVKRYVDPRVKGVSTKYLDIDPQLAEALVKGISTVAGAVYKESGFKFNVGVVKSAGITSVRLTVKKAA